MGTSKKYRILKEADSKYWKLPEKYALLKELDGDIEQYTIFSRVNGKLTMLMHDDFAYCSVLCEKDD